MEQRLIDANEIYSKAQNSASDTDTEKDMKALFRYLLRNANTVLTIPDNPTNGDMIKALFPYFEIYDNADNEEYPYVEVVVSKTDSTCYRKSWWNAPYKEVD